MQYYIGLKSPTRTLFFCWIYNHWSSSVPVSWLCVELTWQWVHPVIFLKYKPLRYRLICCTVAWVICLGSCFVCMYTLGEEDQHLYIWFFSLQFLLFFFIQLFCLVTVLRALKQSGPGDRKKEEENHIKRRAFDLILITYCKYGYHIWSKYNHRVFIAIMINSLFIQFGLLVRFFMYWVVLCSQFFICIALENSPGFFAITFSIVILVD